MKQITVVQREGQAAIKARLDPTWYPETDVPMLSEESVYYQISTRSKAIVCGGLGLVRQLVKHLGIAKTLDRRVEVLKRHFPYHESDHILNMIYNLVTGGCTLEDLERRRRDLAYLDAVGARRIPGPTTAGDFLRRFDEKQIVGLLEANLEIGKRAWKWKRGKGEATIDVDGTIAEVGGDCREGADLAYNGKWGYGPLLVTLANSSEVLWVENRSASRPSHEGSAAALERCAQAALARGFNSVLFRGDTDFTSSASLDGWDQKGYRFVFGMMAHAKAKNLANSLEEGDFKPLKRPDRVPAGLRARPQNQRQLVISAKGYLNLELEEEDVAEIEYRPRKCRQNYRLVILRKTIKVTQGQHLLEPQIRYFFYLTNLPKTSHNAAAIIAESNQRCDQENLIAQLKSQIQAMRMPTKSFLGNWAYLVIGCLAWNLKAWLALSVPKKLRPYIARCDFRTFYHDIILVPAQILRSGRRMIFRLLGFRDTVPWLLEAHHAVS